MLTKIQLYGVKFLLLLAMVSFIQVGNSIAQKGQEPGGLDIDENAVIQSLKRQYLSYNRNNEEISAWRVLLASSNDRRQFDQQLGKFKREYPDTPHTWDYEAPYYKLKAGAYLTRLEARQAMARFKKHFSGAMEIQDRVKKKDFLQ